jgi:hypothetical protein
VCPENTSPGVIDGKDVCLVDPACVCPEGFECNAAKTACVFVDFPPCPPGLVLRQTSTDSPRCVPKIDCGTGFTFDPEVDPPSLASCKDIDECAQSPCSTNAACTNTEGGFTCECIEPYAGDGFACVNNCKANSCKFGGNCTSTLTSFTCDCADPYLGFDCSKDDSGCRLGRCISANTVECVPGEAHPSGDHSKATFTCVCDRLFTGEFCQNFDPTAAGAGSESSSSSSSLPIVAGAAAGGLLLILLVVILVLRRRRRAQAEPGFKIDPNDPWEIDPKDLDLGEVLGEGAFGQVLSGKLQRPNGRMGVACKTVKSDATQEDMKDFTKEIALMKELPPHRNVLGLIGHILRSKPYVLVVELMSQGNLRDYLRKSRGTDDRPSMVSYEQMVYMATQVAAGMSHLSENKVVHRDLAARNVLVDSQLCCKVADFGFARDVYTEDYYRKRAGGKVPFKWMAPESLLDSVSTSASDVWSFGVVMWEIVTLGASPYPMVNVSDLLTKLRNGYRMEQPAGCPDEYYSIMKSCWQDAPSARPTFPTLTKSIAALAKDAGGHDYLEPSKYAAVDYAEVDSDDPAGLLAASTYEAPVLPTNTYASLGDFGANNGEEGYGNVNMVSAGVRQAWGPGYDTTESGYNNVQAGVGTLKDEPDYAVAGDGQAVYENGASAARSPRSSEALYEMAGDGAGEPGLTGDAVYDNRYGNGKATLRRQPGSGAGMYELAGADSSVAGPSTSGGVYDSVRFIGGADQDVGGGPEGYLSVGGLESGDVDVDEETEDGYGFVSDVLRQVALNTSGASATDELDAENRRQTVYERPDGKQTSPVIHFPSAPPERSDARLD